MAATAFSVKEIDLLLRKGCDHPHVFADYKKQYLAKIAGRWVIGTFTRQWYGLNFRREYDVTCGHQLDYNDWEKLFEIL